MKHELLRRASRLHLLGWFGTGAALGAGLAALLAPQPGEHLRRKLSPSARRAARYVLSNTYSEEE